MSVTETHSFQDLYEESVQKLGPQSLEEAKHGGRYTREILGWDRTAKYKAAWAADLNLVFGRMEEEKLVSKQLLFLCPSSSLLLTFK